MILLQPGFQTVTSGLQSLAIELKQQNWQLNLSSGEYFCKSSTKKFWNIKQILFDKATAVKKMCSQNY